MNAKDRKHSVPIIGICRHRLQTDGEGVSTLVAFHGCPRSEFIHDFRQLCGNDWLLTVETSLNVPEYHMERLLPVTDRYIVDIKDMNPEIYRRYTERENNNVLRNLRLLLEHGRGDDIIVRIPLIPGYNTEEDRERSVQQLKAWGLSHFDLFDYTTFKTLEP